MKLFVKKAISLLLALVLVCSLAIRSYSDDETQDIYVEGNEDAGTQQNEDAETVALDEGETDGFDAGSYAVLSDSLNLNLDDPSAYEGIVATPQEGAEELDGLFTQQEVDAYEESIDYYMSLSLPSSSDAMNLISKVDDFIGSGARNAFIDGDEESDLIGMTPNAIASVRPAGDSDLATGSDEVLIIDKDAVAFKVVDKDGQGIGGAIVTIRYMDRAGDYHTVHTHTTSDEKIAGIAAFSGIEDVVYGLVDIQAGGNYSSITLLQERLEPGHMRTVSLNDIGDNQIYVRACDFEGKDMLCEDTTISLISSSDKQLTWSVYLSVNGSAKLPDKISLYSKTRKKEIAVLSDPEKYDLYSDTYIYSLKTNWLGRNADLLCEGDLIVIKGGSFENELGCLSIENAVFDQSHIEEVDMSLGDDLDGKMPASFPPSGDESNLGVGGGGITFAGANFKVSFTVFTDGTFMAMTSYDFEATKKATQTMLPKTDEPKGKEQLDLEMSAFEKQVEAVMSKIEKGMATMKGAQSKVFGNAAFSFSASVMLTYKGAFNKKTSQYEGVFTFCFCINTAAGYTWYWLIPTTIGTIPVYAGVEFTMRSQLGASLGLDTETVFNGPYHIDKNKTSDFDLEFFPSFSAYAGVGLHGMAGIEVMGSANFILALKYAPMRIEPEKVNRQIKLSFNIKLNINLLLATVPFIFYDGSGDPIVIRDDWKVDLNEQDSGQLLTLDMDQAELFDLASVEEQIDLINEGDVDDGCGSLAVYEEGSDVALASETINGNQPLNKIDVNTLSDNQIQTVVTDEGPVLFRTAVINGKTRIIYQKQDAEGTFSTRYYVVNMPDDQDVFEFNVQPYKGEESSYGSYAYIAAVVGDAGAPSVDERAKSTSVAVAVVDVSEGEQLQCQVVAGNPEEDYYYHNPNALAGEDKCYAAFTRADSVNDFNGGSNFMYTASGNIKEIGAGDIYNTGVMLPAGGCVWTIDQTESDRETLVVRGWNRFGTTSYDNKLAFASLDIAGWDYDNVEDLISCWEYINGINYMLINGNVYYLEKAEDASSSHGYALVFKEVAYMDDSHAALTKGDSTYQMFINDEKTGINIVGIKQKNIRDESTNMSIPDGSTITLLTLTAEDNMYVGFGVYLHGPLEIDVDRNISHFSGVFSTRGSKKGLDLVFTEDYSDNNAACDLYQWFQNASRGMVVTEVALGNNIVTSDVTYLDALVTYQNIGYMKEGPVAFEITDENGQILKQYRYSNVTGEYTPMDDGEGYWNDDLLTGDKDSVRVYFAANPDWEANKSHTVNVSVIYPVPETAQSEVSLTLDSAIFDISGEQVIVNGRHVAQVNIDNISIIAGEAPELVIRADYVDGSHKELERVGFGGLILYNSNDNNEGVKEQSYSRNIDLEKYWEKEKTTLRSITICKVDKNGQIVLRDNIELKNPYVIVSDDSEDETETPTETESTKETDPSKETDVTKATNPTKDTGSTKATDPTKSTDSKDGSKPAITGERNIFAKYAVLLILAGAALMLLIIAKARSRQR